MKNHDFFNENQVALTGKDSKNERNSIASRSFIFWPIGKIRLQKKSWIEISEYVKQWDRISDLLGISLKLCEMDFKILKITQK